MNKIAIFIGPRKTGTSWLYNTVFDDTRFKEIRYPSKLGRRYVYERYVVGESLLIWPYLLHDRKSMDALLTDMESRGQKFDLYVSMRDYNEWRVSLGKFIGKYGATETERDSEIESQAKIVSDNLEYLESKYEVVRVKIIHPEKNDIEIMANATGVDEATFVAALDTRVYESLETSRIKSTGLVEIFFRMKPFLPKTLQTITRNTLLRKVFFHRENK